MDIKENPYAKWEDIADTSIPTLTLMIYDGIARDLKEREQGDVNRASSATYCPRRRFYSKLGTDGIPLTPRKIINFTFGNLIELVGNFYIKQYLVGPGKPYSEVYFGEEKGSINCKGEILTEYEQPTLTWKINESLKIRAHIDGRGKRNIDGKWELIEIKSAASYGFDSFKENGPGDYLKQSHAYMMTEELQALGIKEVRYFYFLKETGHPWCGLFKFDQKIADQIRDEYIAVMEEQIPAKPYGFNKETYNRKETGREVLGFPCTYCPYIKTCHPEARQEWKNGRHKGTKKPVWVKEKEKKNE